MKYFSTDGLRGRVGDAYINPEFFVRLGWAIAHSIPPPEGNRRNRIIIGKDTRISGYMLETALQSGMISAGADVQLLGPIPTPGVAYLAHTLKASAGVMVTASHNPYHDNGIKIFDKAGHKISDTIINAIEAHMDAKEQKVVESIQLGKVERIHEANGRYIEHCRLTGGGSLDLSELKIIVDCAHGATYKVAPAIFREMGAEVHAISTAPDGININDGCGSTNPQAVRQEVLENKADLGISFDGDGDRTLVVDKRGRVLDGDHLLYVIATDMLKRGGGCSGVVGTVMSNSGLAHSLSAKGISFARAAVGDMRVWELMKQNNWPLGGEPSGHVICADTGHTGDGMLTALRVIEAMIANKRDIGDWAYEMEHFEQAQRNVRIKRKSSHGFKEVEQSNQVSDLCAQAEKALKDGRIIMRPSGTEPLVRLMVEGRDSNTVNEWADKIKDAIKSALST
jgi:phosphoglucosamine mutase